MNARYREKIRSKVLFPLTALDMGKYKVSVNEGMVKGSAARASYSGSGSDVYDLYGVSNHMGTYLHKLHIIVFVLLRQ